MSLFSGAMGLDLGLECAGFRTRVVLEINKAALETIKTNRPRLPRVEESIQDTSTKELLEKAGLTRDQVTVVAGGPCCQSFSTAGKRGSLSDPRGNLFREFCRVVRDTQPRFFVMENVKGILSAAVKHRPLNKRGPGHPHLQPEERLGSALKEILKELRALNYYVVFGLLNAADYGVPQKRWRVVFIGSRDGEDISIPVPTHRDPSVKPPKGDSRLPWKTLREAIEDVDAENWSDFSESRIPLLRLLKAGQNWRDLPAKLHKEALGAAFESWGGRSGFCRRLSWDEPAPTLTSVPDGRATTLCHPTKIRPLSTEEYAALQQFPEGWGFVGSVAQQYLQIGNAVPIGLSRAIGLSIRSTMRQTGRQGLPQGARERKGTVVCQGDLQKRIDERRETILHPSRLRKIKTVEAAKKWIQASTA